MSDRDTDRAAQPPEPGIGEPRRRWIFAGGGAFARVAAAFDLMRLRLALVFEREMEAGRGFLWLPVLFGAGIVAYFGLPREPSIVATGGVALILFLAAWRARTRTTLFRVLVVAAAVAAGVATAKLRTDLVAAPMLTREMTATVTGWVAERSESSRGGTRLVVRVASIEGLSAEDAPRTVRFTVRSKALDISVGNGITAKARLQPPSGPVIPGGFDFAFAAFYGGIGAVGFAYGAAKPAEIGPAPLSIRLMRPLELLRNTLRVRIEEALPGNNGHIAAALIMGDQGGISEKTQDAMRASGLGHVLSISGLHMAMVAGSAFWLIRALLALSPGLALTRPIKKWAALGALGVGAFYLGISGGGAATDRAFIMLAIMLLAVMIDRRALTLRNVALAAIVVLALAPENVLSASFQMSFAATLALVAAYEAISARAERSVSLAEGGSGVAGKGWRFATGLFLTSLIAGLATTPFAAFHFQRLAPLGLLANLAAMPAVGLIVMPMALLAVVVMPFGLELVPLSVMQWGLDWMISVADWVAAATGDAGAVTMAPAAALFVAASGFLWLALWRERWRLFGLVAIVAALPIALSARQPDVLVGDDGRTVAVRGADGRYQIMGGKGASFEIENWLRADADTRRPTAKELNAGVVCDALGCIAQLGGAGGEVALVLSPDAFMEDCGRAALVVTPLTAPRFCSAETTVIDRIALARTGAEALFLDREGGTGEADAKPRFRTETAYPAIRRPFMPPVPDPDRRPAASISSGE